MKNSKIIIIAASLVLAAALALCGCVYLIGGVPDETRGYDPDEMTLPSVIEETPSVQSELQKKFGAYGREETGERGERIFRLFTEEQINESIDLRLKGRPRSLTYEEVLFIINDSVRIYFEYDKIIVTDFMNHTHNNIPTSALDFDMRLWQNRYKRCDVLSYGYTEIIPYHGDYSDQPSYVAALETYSKMIYDIECMIFERLRIHDTGTDSYCLVSPLNDRDYTRVYGMLFADNQLKHDTDKHRDVLNNSIKMRLTGKELVNPHERYPMILASNKYEADSGKPNVNINYYNGEERVQIFPTEQLEALHPDGKVTLSTTTDDGREIAFELDRWNKHVVYTEKYMGSETVIEGYYTIPMVNSVPADFLSLNLDGERLYLAFDGDYVRNYQAPPVFPKNEDKYEQIKMEVTSFFGEGVGSMELFYEK